MRFRYLFILTVVIGFSAVSQSFAAPNPHLDEARELAKSGDWVKVQAKSEEATMLDPKSDESWRLRGRAELFLGDTTAAIGFYEEALSLNPKQADAIVDLTTVYVALNQLDNADRIVVAGEKKDAKGKIDEIKAARALILGKQGKIGEATPILANATAKHPDNPLYPLMLARIYKNANVITLANDNYAIAWGLDEGNPDIAFEYGQTLLTLKEYDEADKLFKIVQDRDPDNKQVDYLRGRLRHAAKRYAEAAGEFAKAVAKTPDNFLANYWLGRSYVDLSKTEKKNFYGAAIEPLRIALALKPDRKDISVSLAEAEYFIGRSSFFLAVSDSISMDSKARMADEFALQAEDHAGRAKTESDPARATLIQELAAHYRTTETALRDPAAVLDEKHPLRRELLYLSIVTMEHAISDDPEVTKIQDVYSNISRAFDKLAVLDSALFYTNKQLDLTPSSTSDVTRKVSLLQRLKDQVGLAEYLNVLSADSAMFAKYGLILVNSYIETKQYDSARDAVKKVLANDPENCDAHQLNAYIDLSRERYGAAIAPLLDGVKACPKNADMWVYLGDSYYFSNEKDKATVQRAKDAYCHAGSLGSSVGREKCTQIGEILKTMR